MRKNWWLYKGLMPHDWCENMIRMGDNSNLQPAGIFSDNEISEIRNTEVAWMDDEGLNDMCWKIVSKANREFFNVHVTELPAMQYGKYSKGCFYNWHHDVDFMRDHTMDRKLSICIQLSDPTDYIGGEFRFQDYDSPDFTGQGDVLVFPSYHTHMVSKIVQGTRRSLVGWAEGPQWR